MQTQQTQILPTRSRTSEREQVPVLWLAPDLLHGDRRLLDALTPWWSPGVERLRVEARVEGTGVATRVLVLQVDREGFGDVRWLDPNALPPCCATERRVCLVPAGNHTAESHQWSLEEALQAETAFLGLYRQTWGRALVSPEVRRGLRSGEQGAWTHFGRVLGDLMLSIVCTGGQRVVLH